MRDAAGIQVIKGGAVGLKDVTVSAVPIKADLRSRFYQSVAETLTLLHTGPGYDRQQAMSEVVRILSGTMELPLVWIGCCAPDQSNVVVMAAAGKEAAYASSLVLSRRADDPNGNGAAGRALREHRAQAMMAEDAGFAPWRAMARRHGLTSCFAAASATRDGGQLVLAAYASDETSPLSDSLLDWVQRLADELGRFWDQHALLERNERMSRYRDAQRTIQRALLEQPDPDAVYRTLAQSLVDIAGAAAVDVHVLDDDNHLRRVALAGPMADAMRDLSPETWTGAGVHTPLPMKTAVQGTPHIRIRPREHDDMSSSWRIPPLDGMGAAGCWPLVPPAPGERTSGVQAGVFAVVTREEDAFDEEMCRLLEEISEATGMALRQHLRRRALLEEQQRQTYLAMHDALTGLPNRRALDMHLECAMARAERSESLVVAGLLDLDDLKPINDRYGHAVGDRLLVAVAQRLRHALRADDYVARLGGDEFVLVCEGLQHESDLDGLLEDVWQELRQPLVIDEVSFELAASLGIALYPTHVKGSGEQLLRRADQAMYEVKARKRQRERWWSLPLAPGAVVEPEDHDGRGQQPYGAASAVVMRRWSELAASRLPQLVDALRAELRTHEGLTELFSALPPGDLAMMAERLAENVRLLTEPELSLEKHREHARQSGRFHAAAGVEEVWLLEGIERLRDLVASMLGDISRRDRRPLSIVLQRLGLERQWQLESMRDMQRERVALLARLNGLAWSADGYLELIQGVVDALAAHDEISSCAVGRPDHTGQLTYEAVGGEGFANYLRELAQGKVAAIRVNADSPEGQGPSGRAWRTNSIQRCLHYATDPAMSSWQDAAPAMGIVSSVALPLCPIPPSPAAVLTIYSGYAGGLRSEDQQAFVEQLKNLLDLALARLAPPRSGAAMLPFFVRERWRAMVEADLLEVHYQPVVRLSDGQVGELEALARLRESDGLLLMPGRFLPALGDDDLVRLFRHVLGRATVLRETFARRGRMLDVSVNAPAAAIEDPRYAEAAAAALATGTCPADALLFEILESPVASEQPMHMTMEGMKALKALGVRLVEDDLGAGYSSLIRLRQWPFDRVKIDQAIVAEAADDPLRTLRFIRQLIRLGHDLELEVVVEGLETEGLIEAALLLGADLGQGYALARPMPPEALPDWLNAFGRRWDAGRPLTALGALAGAMLWEEQLLALPTESSLWRKHAEAPCATGSYLEHGSGFPPALLASHMAMLSAAANGPLDPVYRSKREQFVALLVDRVREEELHSLGT